MGTIAKYRKDVVIFDFKGDSSRRLSMDIADQQHKLAIELTVGAEDQTQTIPCTIETEPVVDGKLLRKVRFMRFSGVNESATAGYGLVSLQRNVRDVQPIGLATEFLVVLDLRP